MISPRLPTDSVPPCAGWRASFPTPSPIFVTPISRRGGGAFSNTTQEREAIDQRRKQCRGAGRRVALLGSPAGKARMIITVLGQDTSRGLAVDGRRWSLRSFFGVQLPTIKKARQMTVNTPETEAAPQTRCHSSPTPCKATRRRVSIGTPAKHSRRLIVPGPSGPGFLCRFMQKNLP